MTTIYLVRHGETTLGEGAFAGSLNPPLSDFGRLTAERLRDRLKNEWIDAFYSSSMIRAIETAGIISKPHVEAKGEHLVPSQIGFLNEIDHGHWEGKSTSEVINNWPDEYIAWGQDPFLFAPQDGEPAIKVVARAIPAIDSIVANSVGKTALVVSHKATIRLILCHYLGIPFQRYRDAFDIDRMSLTKLIFRDPKSAKLTLFNDTSHLDEALSSELLESSKAMKKLLFNADVDFGDCDIVDRWEKAIENHEKPMSA